MMTTVKRYRRPFDSHASAVPVAAEIVRRWPWITTRIVRERGVGLWVEYTRRRDLNPETM